MIRHINTLSICLVLGLALSIATTLLGAIAGDFIALGAGFVLCFIFVAMLVVLFQERRIQQIIGTAPLKRDQTTL